uniref:CRAL-TRIO domain-containing protein n=1 Tax=Syphacia muris TaxID=451379 RepID=A0A0N5AY18_9BILA
MSVYPLPAPCIGADELNLVTQLRNRLNEVLTGGIPNDLDTDLNLVRWIRGYQGNINKITEVFPVYCESRKAAGFVGENFVEEYFQLPQIKPYLKFIASSRLGDRLWFEENNAFLFVERAWSQPKEKGNFLKIVKAMKCSDYLLHCFGYSEMLLQLILRREKYQDAGKGPVQFIVLFDLSEVNLSDYLNPLSTHIRLWQLRSELWQDWYPEMVQRIFLVNPPRLISVLWKLAKLFLNEQNCKLIEIPAHKKDLLKHLPAWFVPKEFGGEFINTIPPGDESGISRRRKIVVDDHYRSHEIYKRKNIARPKPLHKEIGSGEKFVCEVEVKDGESLLWDFTANGELVFVIYACDGNDNRTMVYPQLRLASSKLPEEGILEKTTPGLYIVEFFNNTTYFNIKLDYCIVTA